MCSMHKPGVPAIDSKLSSPPRTKSEQCNAAWEIGPRITISFHSHLWNAYNGLNDPAFRIKDGEKSQRLRLKIGLASTIVHEIAHAVWYYARPREDYLYGKRANQNRIHYDAATESSELGFACENWMFSANLNALAPMLRRDGGQNNDDIKEGGRQITDALKSHKESGIITKETQRPAAEPTIGEEPNGDDNLKTKSTAIYLHWVSGLAIPSLFKE